METSSESMNTGNPLSATKRALVALKEMQSELETLKYEQREPIAIVGMACRFPGGVDSPESLWKILHQGIDTITEVPKNRWNINDYYDPEAESPGKISNSQGGFIDEIDTFDPEFFSISPRETQSLDPQQRLLLEVSWEALENAHQVSERLFNSRTGVFIGISGQDYAYRLLSTQKEIDGYLGTGNAFSVAAGRLSYVLGLTGPSLAVETACSSSLVTVHLACQSLRNRECNMALAGGVNLLLSPYISITFSQAGMLAPDGRCKTFDAAANGYVRGEGCGMIVLKRLSDAIADRDNILAVIRGSAVNQDGPSGGLTVPNGPSQEAVIQQALKNGGVDPGDVSYIEAHGTGTSLGDPIEVGALGAVFGKNHSREQPLILGSIKTNMGHMEAAAGIAGLMKVVLQMQHQEIAPHLHFQQPTPYINWSDLPVVVHTQATPWQLGVKSRIAGVSSFSFNGTNAHIVLEETPSQVASPKATKTQDLEPKNRHLLTISAKTDAALWELASRYQQHLEKNPDLDIADICYTASTGRTNFNQRLAIIAENKSELAAKLGQGEVDILGEGLFKGSVSKTPKVAFLFTGQGSQYVNMGRELYETQSVFREALDECDRLLREYIERPLLEILYPQKEGDGSLLDQTAYTQPTLFALEYALTSLWQSWGIKPDALMGHSVGEYVAATVAGVFSLSDGLKLIVARGRLMQQLPRGGKMVAVRTSAEQIRKAIADYADSVSLAAINGPESVVISGAGEAIASICSHLEDRGIKTKPLQVSHAFHSPLMSPMLGDFATIADRITYNRPRIPLISNVTGQRADERIATSTYWVNHVLQPVTFAESMETLHQLGYGIFLEIGPKPILLGMGRLCLPDDVGVWLPSLHPEQQDWQQILSSLAQLYVRGVKVDWSGLYRGSDRAKITLPTYPFQKERYWIEAFFSLPRAVPRAKPKNQVDLHPLLGEKLDLPVSQEIHFSSSITKDFPAYLNDHRIYERVVFLGACYLEMALAAGVRVFNSENLALAEVNFVKALVLPENGEETVVHLVLSNSEQGKASWQIFSQTTAATESENSWELHAYGKIISEEQEIPEKVDIATLIAKFNDKETEELYNNIIDMAYGPLLRNMEQVWQDRGEVLSKIQLQPAPSGEIEDYVLHPALLDSCFQTMFTLIKELDTSQQVAYLPIGCQTLSIYRRPTTQLWSYAQLDPTTSGNSQILQVDVKLFSPEGELIAKIEGLQGKKTTSQALFASQKAALENLLYEVQWRPKGRFGQVLEELRDPLAVQEKLDTRVLPSISQSELDSYDKIIEKLEQLTVEYVLQALKEMGWSFQPGTSFSTELAAQRLAVIPTQRRLFNRLLQMLAEEKLLEFSSAGWQVLQPLAAVNPEANSQNLLQQYPHARAELTLLSRCGEKLSAVLRGALDPVELVFPKGDLTTATQLYQESPLAKVMNVILAEAIATAIEDVPPAEGIRLLEIGAGTGGTTSHILPKLNPSQTEYVFTDIGALFTSKAQEKFSAYPFVSYQTLDIEKDPASQGFEPGKYQIIVAANVLHATTSMAETLDHVRELLAPGGLLLLMEGTIRQRWFDLIFGLLEGWWKFQDLDLRPDYPLMSGSTWQELLTEKGFAKVVTIEKSTQAVIIAQTEKKQVESRASRDWLILADKQGIAEQLATKLRSSGDACTLVFAGDEYKKIEPAAEYIINPQKSEDFEQLVKEVAGHSQNLHGVVQCWSLEGAQGEKLTASELEALSQEGCGSTLFLLQALTKAPLELPPRLWLATKGAQPVPQGEEMATVPGVSQSSLWGMGKVIDLEHPEFNCVCMDLDPHGTVEQQAMALWAEIGSENAENQVALREDARYVARLASSNQHDKIEKPLALRSDATYLITGGLGGLGLLVADWMVQRGAKHLVLVGRSGATDAAQSRLKSLEQAGAEVVVAKCNVSDMESLGRVISDIQQSLPPLAGLFHSVGVLSDGVLQQQSWSSFTKVMHPKMQGAWHLHQLTQDLSLDFFVLFSSIASTLGSAGQGNHSTANAFLDALAYYRKGMGLPGLSINWGPVSAIGAAALKGADERVQKKGMKPITPQEVLETLELLMSSDTISAGVVHLDWGLWLQQVPKWPFYADWQETVQLDSASGSEFLEELTEARPKARYSLLLGHVREQVRMVLGLKASKQIAETAGFFDLGMDSLTSVELRNRLQTSLRCSISSTMAFDYPTLEDLVEYLAQEVLNLELNDPATEAKASEDDEEQKELLAKTKALTEEQLEDLINQKFDLLIQE